MNWLVLKSLPLLMLPNQTKVSSSLMMRRFLRFKDAIGWGRVCFRLRGSQYILRVFHLSNRPKTLRMTPSKFLLDSVILTLKQTEKIYMYICAPTVGVVEGVYNSTLIVISGSFLLTKSW